MITAASFNDSFTPAASICTACGTQYPANDPLPEICPICQDDRQFVPGGKQEWISYSAMADTHAVHFEKINEQLYAIRMIPSFAIGQRAFLILSEHGNILWDCIPLINEAAATFIRSKGGLKAIAFSHPHFFSSMHTWAVNFDCPIYIHADNRPWTQAGSRIKFWDGDHQDLWDGIRIYRIGGHFPGSSLMRVPAPGKALLYTGDTLYISRNLQHIAVMHSFPNQIPLSYKTIVQIRERMAPIEFDGIYGPFEWQNMPTGAGELFERSMNRYCEAYGH